MYIAIFKSSIHFGLGDAYMFDNGAPFLIDTANKEVNIGNHSLFLEYHPVAAPMPFSKQSNRRGETVFSFGKFELTYTNHRAFSRGLCKA